MYQNAKEKRHFFLDHPILFGIGCLVLSSFLSIVILVPVFFWTDPYSPAGTFAAFAVHGLLAGAFALLFKKALGMGYVIGFTGRHLILSLTLGWIFIPVSLVNLYADDLIPSGFLHLTLRAVLIALFSAAGAAVSEEILFRGIIAGSMMRVWGRLAKGIYAVFTASSLLFGAFHALNAVQDGFTPALWWQMAYTCAMGLVYAAVYLRTKNLWGPVILHGLLDFTGFLGAAGHENVDPVTEVLSSFVSAEAALFYCVITAVFTAAAIWLLRPEKLAEIRAVWNGDHQEKNQTSPPALPQTAKA